MAIKYNYYMKFLFVLGIMLGLIFLSGANVYSQRASDNFLLKGIILNSENETPVPFVTIYNTTLLRVSSSDSTGNFIINAKQGDSLAFTSLGFEKQVIVLEKGENQNQNFIVKLIPKVYELQSVDIHAFKTEEAFKRHILAMEIPEEEKLAIPGMEYVQPFPSGSGEGGVTITGPISYLSNQFSRRAKEHRKYLAAKEAYNYQNALAKKYNPEFVKNITKLEDPQELEKFMKFCKLEDSFIEKANEYELILAVNDCYNEYTQKQENIE